MGQSLEKVTEKLREKEEECCSIEQQAERATGQIQELTAEARVVAAGCRIGKMAGCCGRGKEVGGMGSKTGAAPGGAQAEASREDHGQRYRW